MSVSPEDCIAGSTELVTGNLLIWLDDMLGYAEDADTIISIIKSVLTICNERGLKLNPREGDLMATNVQFCGLIDAKGVTFHARHYEALTSMEAPTTVGALMELVHGSNWMRTAIPRFSELIEPQEVASV